jgi:hypothetical protein
MINKSEFSVRGPAKTQVLFNFKNLANKIFDLIYEKKIKLFIVLIITVINSYKISFAFFRSNPR